MSMKAAVIGFEAEGASAYRYLTAQGADVTIHDARSDLVLPEGARSVLGPDYLKHLDGYDVVVRSPHIKPWSITTNASVTSAMSLFFEHCPARIIGVTGTKGKSTTVALIARMLGEAGWRTWVGGGGQPPLDFLAKVRASHLIVLELSSFELTDLPVSPHIAVSLMIVPDHLDWHRSVREYVAAKGNIFWHQRPEDLAIYDAKNEFSQQIPYLMAPGARIGQGKLIIEEDVICDARDVALIGVHNLDNVCAAVTATWDLVKHNGDAVKRAITSFSGLEHRLELAGEVLDVQYYDDSYSTAPESTMAAMAAFTTPKVLILGGAGKQGNYLELARAVSEHNVRHVVATGEAAQSIQKALESVGYLQVVTGPSSMAEIMTTARGLAQKGDVVLLSPGCPVDDGFKDYKDRGAQFKAIIRDWS
jgi:UDP-N-acetylmuramoylalanine--D-glutamate ligase